MGKAERAHAAFSAGVRRKTHGHASLCPPYNPRRGYVTIAPDVLKRRISEGVLGFPVTPFLPDLSVDTAAFEAHIAHLAGFRPTALVPVGGAGELFSLEQLARALRDQAAGGL